MRTRQVSSIGSYKARLTDHSSWWRRISVLGASVALLLAATAAVALALTAGPGIRAPTAASSGTSQLDGSNGLAPPQTQAPVSTTTTTPTTGSSQSAEPSPTPSTEPPRATPTSTQATVTTPTALSNVYGIPNNPPTTISGCPSGNMTSTISYDPQGPDVSGVVTNNTTAMVYGGSIQYENADGNTGSVAAFGMNGFHAMIGPGDSQAWSAAAGAGPYSITGITWTWSAPYEDCQGSSS